MKSRAETFAESERRQIASETPRLQDDDEDMIPYPIILIVGLVRIVRGAAAKIGLFMW